MVDFLWKMGEFFPLYWEGKLQQDDPRLLSAIKS